MSGAEAKLPAGIEKALQNPNEALIALDRLDAKQSLSKFTELAWPHLDSEVYQHNWHMDAICEHLEACFRGEINRLLINVPPGTSKSSATCVFFPAWLWGPAGAAQMRFIGASHSLDNAIRDNRKTRKLIETEWYQQRWPTRLATDQNIKTNFENTSGGFREVSAVTSMTGKRGHFVVWDDPQNPEKANSDTERQTATRIFSETLTSRLVNPSKSVIIVIMQRLHEADVSGHILARDLGYEHLMLPMEFEPERRCYTSVKPRWRKTDPIEAVYDAEKQVWYMADDVVPDARESYVRERDYQIVYPQDPRERLGELLFEDRFPRKVVERDNKAMGDYAAAGQQQQRPAPREGGMFTRTDFVVIEATPPCVKWIRGWDLAASTETGSAYTAGVKMGVTSDGRYIIEDIRRGQLNSAGVETLVRNTAKLDGRKVRGSVPQDPGAGGKAWARAIVKAAAGYPYKASTESGDKVTRAEPFAAQVQINNVFLVRGAWNEPFLDEAESFPNGKFKDQIDACSRAFMELTTKSKTASSGTYG